MSFGGRNKSRNNISLNICLNIWSRGSALDTVMAMIRGEMIAMYSGAYINFTRSAKSLFVQPLEKTENTATTFYGDY